jgi:hypothetical protein
MNEFPKAKVVKIDTVSGTAYSRKSDILKRMMWFAYEDAQAWIPLTVDKVNELMEANKEGKQAPNLSELVPASMIQQPSNSGAEADTITNEELLREDKEFEEELRRKRERNDRSGSRPQQKGRDNRGRDGRPGDNRPPQNRNQGQNRNDNRRPNPENRPPRPEGTGTPADRQNTGGQNNRNPRHNRNRSRDQRDFKGKGNQGNTPPTDKPQG